MEKGVKDKQKITCLNWMVYRVVPIKFNHQWSCRCLCMKDVAGVRLDGRPTTGNLCFCRGFFDVLIICSSQYTYVDLYVGFLYSVLLGWFCLLGYLLQGFLFAIILSVCLLGVVIYQTLWIMFQPPFHFINKTYLCLQNFFYSNLY